MSGFCFMQFIGFCMKQMSGFCLVKKENRNKNL